MSIVTAGIKDAEIAAPSKYTNIFLRTLDISLISCNIYLTITWPENYIISNVSGATSFPITHTQLQGNKIINSRSCKFIATT